MASGQSERDDDQVRSQLEQEILTQLRGFEHSSSPEFAAQVLSVFIDDTSARLASLRDALEIGDAKRVYEAAHSIQGSASMIGVTSLASACRDLASAGRNGSLDVCKALAAQVTAGFDVIQRAVADRQTS